MGTNCAPFVADLFLFCYESDFMMSLSDDIIEAFNSTSIYLDDLSNSDYPYFEGMGSLKCFLTIAINKANSTDTKGTILDLHLLLSNDFVSSKIYDKRDDFDFNIVNFPLFGWRRSSCPVIWCLCF